MVPSAASQQPARLHVHFGPRAGSRRCSRARAVLGSHSIGPGRARRGAYGGCAVSDLTHSAAHVHPSRAGPAVALVPSELGGEHGRAAHRERVLRVKGEWVGAGWPQQSAPLLG